jgi:hypothetical protein
MAKLTQHRVLRLQMQEDSYLLEERAATEAEYPQEIFYMVEQAPEYQVLVQQVMGHIPDNLEQVIG